MAFSKMEGLEVMPETPRTMGAYLSPEMHSERRMKSSQTDWPSLFRSLILLTVPSLSKTGATGVRERKGRRVGRDANRLSPRVHGKEKAAHKYAALFIHNLPGLDKHTVGYDPKSGDLFLPDTRFPMPCSLFPA